MHASDNKILIENNSIKNLLTEKKTRMIDVFSFFPIM